MAKSKGADEADREPFHWVEGFSMCSLLVSCGQTEQILWALSSSQRGLGWYDSERLDADLFETEDGIGKCHSAVCAVALFEPSALAPVFRLRHCDRSWLLAILEPRRLMHSTTHDNRESYR
jgi:hypothetical protein